MSQELSFAERRDWLRLIRTPTIGPVAFDALLKRYGNASEALGALPSLIRKKTVRAPAQEAVEAEMEACDRAGVRLIAACEPDYPLYLRAVEPPPPVISVLGRTDILHKPCLAIIGSRNASALGQKFAGTVAAQLGEAGYTIVSGMARGIDAAAHGPALPTGTAAVLGGGVDHIYPRQNTKLYEQIVQQGAVVSESPLGYRASARDFPRRNRIISGLSLGVVVIEAAERSGTLITARYALEQNRDVMAAPGSPLDPRTKGCNRLIQQGAYLVESAQDIIDLMDNRPAPMVSEPDRFYASPSFDFEAAQGEIEKAKQIILNLLSPTPTPRDDVIRAGGLPTPIANAALLELELNADILVEPDGRVCRNL